MRYLIVSAFLTLFSAFRLPIKMAQEKITGIGRISSTLGNGVDSLVNQMDDLPRNFVDFAETLIGTPYVWGSTNPKVGVDCSGFVNYVSKHFGIAVPRTSAQFGHLGTAVLAGEAQTGDIILFTGSNAKKRVVGHMGIVTENPEGDLHFIHSSSGHKRGVHISKLTGYYKARLVKIIRIFPLGENRMIQSLAGLSPAS
jgi:cell wall-associated NlpC family hydrolase